MGGVMAEQVTPRFKKPRKKRIADRNKRAEIKRAKRPGNDLDYLKKIKRLPCIITGRRDNIDPHHLKCMGGRGMGMKAPDRYLVPLQRMTHSELEDLGSKNEEEYFFTNGIDCKKLAKELYLMRCSFPDMEAVWQKHWDNKPKILKQQ